MNVLFLAGFRKKIDQGWDMRKKLIIAILVLIAGLTNCGGGGGGSSLKAPNYAGSWSGGVSLVSNTCPRAIPEEFKYIQFLHNVDQGVSENANGNTIVEVVLFDGSDTFTGLGQVDANGLGDSFSTTGSPHELPGFLNSYTCIEILDYEYDSIEFFEDPNNYDTAGFVTRHSSIKCTRGSEVKTCDVTYTGSGYRTAEAF